MGMLFTVLSIALVVAVLGLGLLDDPTTETILIRLIGDANEDITLRGLAAEYLPAQLSAEGRRFLRDMLRAERLPTPLVIGALRTLGRVRDHEDPLVPGCRISRCG